MVSLKQTWNVNFSLKVPEGVASLIKRRNGNLKRSLKHTRRLTAAKSELNSNIFLNAKFKTGSALVSKVSNFIE
jgi:hypothetical protein